jgi:hypothetical protein
MAPCLSSLEADLPKCDRLIAGVDQAKRESKPVVLGVKTWRVGDDPARPRSLSAQPLALRVQLVDLVDREYRQDGSAWWRGARWLRFRRRFLLRPWWQGAAGIAQIIAPTIAAAFERPARRIDKATQSAALSAPSVRRLWPLSR